MDFLPGHFSHGLCRRNFIVISLFHNKEVLGEMEVIGAAKGKKEVN